MSKHVDAMLALALAALPDEDPERCNALAHAATCPSCQALLDQGERLLRAIDAEHTPEPVDPALKARIKTAVIAQPDAAASTPLRERWAALALALCMLVSLVLALADGQARGSFSPAVGLHCLLYELAFSALSLGGLWWLARRQIVLPGPVVAAALAAGFALFGQVLLRVRCPVHDALAHVLAFHLGGVLLAAALGLSAARWFVRR